VYDFTKRLTFCRVLLFEMKGVQVCAVTQPETDLGQLCRDSFLIYARRGKTCRKEQKAFLYLPRSASRNGISETRVRANTLGTDGKIQGNERRKRRFKASTQEFHFNYIILWQNGNWFCKNAPFHFPLLFALINILLRSNFHCCSYIAYRNNLYCNFVGK